MLQAIHPYPNVVQEAARANYGPKVKKSDLPLTTMAQTEQFVLKDTVQQYDTSFPLEHDLYWRDLMNQGGLLGLDAAATPDQTVTRVVPEPVKPSTIYLVVGGAALLVAGSIVLWAWSRR